jgi:hypothetical protein
MTTSGARRRGCHVGFVFTGRAVLDVGNDGVEKLAEMMVAASCARDISRRLHAANSIGVYRGDWYP